MWWPNGRASDSMARGRGFDPHSGRRIVSLSKIHLPPKSTGNTQEAVALSRHDRKIVYWTLSKNETKRGLRGSSKKSIIHVIMYSSHELQFLPNIDLIYDICFR